MAIGLEHYLFLSGILFAIGAAGLLLRRNIIVVLMCIELMLNGANVALVAASRYNGSLDGQTMAIFVMAVAAAEVAVGLAIIIAVFRIRHTLNIDELSTLKG